MAYFTSNPYPMSREPVYATSGVVATSQPLASQAGLHILRSGGNAVDAAIATAAALTVVEPTSNGLGSDAFALIWADDELHGINGSGRAPAGLNREAVVGHGHAAMPIYGWLSVTVPGAVRLWADAHERFGRLPFAEVLAPAIHYARHGFPLSPVLAMYWQRAAADYGEQPGAEFDGWRQVFMPNGFRPSAGTLWHSEGHARTLEAIARSRAEAFYSGEVAAAIEAYARATGGLLRRDDLAAHRSEWVQPISARYRGHEIWEIPPNNQGLAALEALRILDGLTLPATRDTVAGLHLQIEAMKLAFEDSFRHIGDPAHVDVPVEKLLSAAHCAELRDRIGKHALMPSYTRPFASDTVYLCSADSDGMMVSFIQSNFHGFGSGVVVPEYGLSMQNRGYNFTLEPGHPNELKPGKRPYHTIMPGFLSRDDGKPLGPFGVMGGFMQPQGHVQMVVNTIDYQMNPQTALDAPRWSWSHDRAVRVEPTLPVHLMSGLGKRGHDISVGPDGSGFGRGQIIWRRADGVYEAGSDSRTDGQVAAF